MPHLTKVIDHTLSTAPTRIGCLKDYYNSSGAVATVANGVYTINGDANVDLYKGIRDLIMSIDPEEDVPFPFTYSFLADNELVYTSGQLTPKFTIGAYTFTPYVDSIDASFTSYIPRIDPAPYPWTKYNTTPGNSNSLRWVTKTNAELSTGEYRKNNSIRDLSDLTSYRFAYTLHLYYNSEYFYIGWQAADRDNIEGLMFFAHMVDRENIDHYFVTACPGAFYASVTATDWTTTGPFISPGGIGTYASIIYIYKAGVNLLPKSGCSCYCNLIGNVNNCYAMPNIAFQLGSSSTSSNNTIALKGSGGFGNVSSTFATSCIPIINPCAEANSSLSSTNFPAHYLDLGYFTNKTAKDVYVSNPIMFHGILQFSNQILVASDNIVIDQEYEFNNKNYYCPGTSACTSFAIPFLLEY